MAKIFEAEILSNEEVAEKIYRLTVDAPELARTARAGQFVQVKISDDFTLRRPLGIASTFGGRVKIFYRVVGRGTETLSTKKAGERLNILGALGNGYSPREGKVLLVGGGMGLAPLLLAAEKFSADVLMGGRNQGEVLFWQEEFKPHADKIFITTDDGSYARKGFAVDLLPDILATENYSAILTCGPEMLSSRLKKICLAKFPLKSVWLAGLARALAVRLTLSTAEKKFARTVPFSTPKLSSTKRKVHLIF